MPQAVEALVDASTWPGHGLNVGSAEDAQGKQEKRRLVELFQRSGGHMHCMCSLERNIECTATGGLWRPEIGSLALLASQCGREVMFWARDRLNMRFYDRTKKFRIWTNWRCNTST